MPSSMSLSFRRVWGIGVCVAALAGYAALPLFFPKSSLVLTAAGDGSAWILILASAVIATANAVRERGQTRVFWALMAVGCLTWSFTLGMWAYYEVLLRREIPEPFFGDVILFIHVIPMIGAAALRPHHAHQQEKLHLSTLNFVMLLIWWVFLYAFIVFPDEYVVPNKLVYTNNYDRLYILENMVLLATLAFFVWTTRGAWRKLYGGLLAALGLYTLGSSFINAAITKGTYYTGSWYDVPLLAALFMLIWTFIQAHKWNPEPEAVSHSGEIWRWLPTRLAMAAMLSAPLLGAWALFADDVPRRMEFRVAVTFFSILVLGFFIFLRQSLLDRELLRLLAESHKSLENLQRLQNKLIQKEKLAALGQLAAGAAHEINNPLAAILGYSDLLMNSDLSAERKSTIQKIAHQARRTRDLISRLLSFANQTPGEKGPVEVGSLLQRALQLETLRREDGQVSVTTNIAPDLPQVWGNSTQLLQCFMQIISNARDALLESNGGTFSVNARRDGNEVLVEFSDSGPGITEPHRVFDPFYTTKEVGKGAGLGLSATYGIVQEHGGQIICENRPEGGAVFTLRLPVAQNYRSSKPELVNF
jgi:signal transduction histidine kinase